MTLVPEIREFLEKQAASGAPAVWEAPLSTIRANTQGRIATSGPVEDIHSVENRFVPGPTADLPIRIYRPTDRKDAPAILYFHGGGFVLNFLDIYDASLTRLANQSGCTVISVNYQKAPEHPFPTPFDDCYATYLWVKEHADELRINSQWIAVAGDSAGANLASAVALKARDNKIEIPLQILIYPCNGRIFTTDSYEKNATGYGLTTQAMKWFWDQYLQGDEHDTNPYAIPMTAQSFKDCAPAIVITAQYDPLLSDGEQYAALLHRDSVPVIYKQYDGMIHGFFTNMAVTDRAREAIDFVAEEVKKVMA
jgi:acetyl esterase